MRTPSLLLSIPVLLGVACGDKDDDTGAVGDAGHDHGADEDASNGDDPDEDGGEDDDEEEGVERVGFEILQVVSQDEVIVWINDAAMTIEEFEAIDLDSGWLKNQPREGEPDGASFAMSPDATEEGDFTVAEHYGHPWLHNATVVAINQPVDEGGLLTANLVAKHHTVTWNAGRTLYVLTAPDGEHFVRVSRDAGRTSDDPTLPSDWTLSEVVTAAELTFALPNPTTNLRCDNEDSFQGPVSAETLGL